MGSLKPVNEGSLLERAEAQRFNLEHRHLVLLTVQRFTIIMVILAALGYTAEAAGNPHLAAAFFVPAIVAFTWAGLASFIYWAMARKQEIA